MKISSWNFIYDKDPQIRRIGIFGVIYLFALLLIGLIIFNWRFLFYAFVGGAVSLLNFFWLKLMIDSIMRNAPPVKVFYPALKYLLRLGLIATATYVIIKFKRIHLIGFVLGFSAVVAGVMLESFYQIFKRKGGGEI